MLRVVIISIFLTFACFAQNEKNILILHSYHQSYKWTDDENKGIVSELKKSNKKIRLYIEYMDTKRYIDKDHYSNLEKTYKTKYKNVKFDVIISTDNNALEFLKRYNSTLFKGTPVIFSGANYIKKEEFKNYPNFKGISEEANLKKNYELIKQLHPNVKNIYTIIDDTTTGKIIKKEVEGLSSLYKSNGIKYEIINGRSYDEFIKKVKSIPKDSVILLSVYFRTKDGKFFEYYEISQLLEKLDVAPIYGLWDFYFENGIVGGHLTSGLFQGKEAGKLALKVLNGVPIKSIKTIYKSPNKNMFDYKKLQKYGIELSELPKNSYIINRPETFYDIYKKEILTLVIIFIFMFILIILLLINMKRRVDAEKRIKKQLLFQQTLMDTIEAPVYYKDLKGRYIGCNKAFESVNGVKEEDILGKTVYDVFPVEIAEVYDQKDKELLESGGSQEYESSRVSQKNEKEYLIFYKKVFYDEKGDVNGIVGAIFDITPLKLASKKLNELNKNLENKVKERTKELETTINNLQNTQDKLVEAEKMASLGSLVAGVAHEINTPLGIALTGVTHLDSLGTNLNRLYKEKKMSQEEFEDFLEQTSELSVLIVKNLTRASDLVKSFKQISVDQTNEEKRRFYLRDYLNDIILSLNNILKKTKHKISIDIDERIAIDNYPGAFSQIFTNLIINSINHGFKDKKEGQISIVAKVEANQLTICYRDNGEGIKDENINKIFDPFFTTNREHGGTGLGLNIIYNIVTRLLKGSIECKSKKDLGVEFKIIVPLNLN